MLLNTESILKEYWTVCFKSHIISCFLNPVPFWRLAPDRDKRNIFMQKSGPGTEAQSESISSGDRNLIQVILLFIPHLTDLKDFSTSLTLLQTSLGNVCTGDRHQESLGWNFWSPWNGFWKYRRVQTCLLKEGRGFMFLSPCRSPLGKKANNQSLFPLKRILCYPQVGLTLDTIFKSIKKKKFILLEKTEVLLTLF